MDLASLNWWGRLSLLALVAGCGPASECQDDWCGTIVVTSPAEAASLLPIQPSSDVDVSMHGFLYDKLADVGPSLNTIGDADFIPVLAESWDYPDDRTIRFSLHPDARWHDGTPVTAADVVFTYEVFRDPVAGSSATPRLAFVESVVAVGQHQVDIRFERRYPEMFFDAVYHVRIMPAHLLAAVPHDELGTHDFARHPVGSGPYRFVRWNAAEFVEFDGNSGYHLGRPGIRRVVWRFTGNPTQSLTQIMAGEADVLNPIFRAEDQARVDELPDYHTIPYPYPVYAYLAFNFRSRDDPAQPHPIFAETEARRALALLVDVAGAVQGVFGSGATPAAGPLTPMYGELHDAFPPPTHSPDQALATLADLGWVDSDADGVLDRDGVAFEIEMIVPNSSGARMATAQVVQEQLRGFGVRVHITDFDHPTWTDRSEAGRFDLTFGALQHDPSPSSVTDSWTSSAYGSYNYGHYSNPDFDALAEEARLAPDLDRARTLWRQAFRAAIDGTPAIWMYVPAWAAGLHTRFENVSIRPDQWSATLWQWRVNPRNLLPRDLVGSN